jgi:hypothetical protein
MGAIGEVGFAGGTAIPTFLADTYDDYDAEFAGIRIAIRTKQHHDPYLMIPDIDSQWPVRKAHVLVLMRLVTPLWTAGFTQVEFVGFCSARKFNRINADRRHWQKFNEAWGFGPVMHHSELTKPVTVATFKRTLRAACPDELLGEP